MNVVSLMIVLFSLVIEHLPQELRDRFTEMREMDLSVQSKLVFGKHVRVKLN